MKKIKLYLRTILRPLFIWLGYAADKVAFDNFPLEDNLSGFQRKIIGIYSSMDHSKIATKAQVWEPIISEKRQLELAKELAKAKANKEALEHTNARSEYQAAVYRLMSRHLTSDAEMIWLIDVFNYEAGIEDAMNSGPVQLLKGLGILGGK